MTTVIMELLYIVPVHVSERLQDVLVNAVVVDDLYLQLKVVRASLSQALGLQVHMVDNLKQRNQKKPKTFTFTKHPSLRTAYMDTTCKCDLTC